MTIKIVDEYRTGVATLELVRPRVATERAEALLAARAAMVEEFRAHRPGFLRARLVRMGEDDWLDLVEWRSSADLAASRARGGDTPGVQAFLDLIEEVFVDEKGEIAEVREPAG